MKKILFAALLFASCTKQHTTQLTTTAKITYVNIDRTLYLDARDSYSATGRPLVAWQWEVGNLRVSGEKVMVMANPGVVLVRLVVTDDAGKTAEHYNSITVK